MPLGIYDSAARFAAKSALETSAVELAGHSENQGGDGGTHNPRLRTPQVPGPGSGARDAVLRLGSKRPHRGKSKRGRARPETREDIPGNPKPKPGPGSWDASRRAQDIGLGS
jgi:hypothetical protein